MLKGDINLRVNNLYFGIHSSIFCFLHITQIKFCFVYLFVFMWMCFCRKKYFLVFNSYTNHIYHYCPRQYKSKHAYQTCHHISSTTCSNISHN